MGEVWRRATPSSTGPSRSRCSSPSTPTTRSSAPASRPRPATPPRCTTPASRAVFDFGEAHPDDGSSTPRPYLVMELVDGQPLSDLLRPGAPLDPEVVRDLLAQAADALGAAHARRHRAPRRQAGQPARHARPPDQGDRLRHRPRRRGGGADPDRPGDGHARLHLARAGRGQLRHRRLRRLLPRPSWPSSASSGASPSSPTPRSPPRSPTCASPVPDLPDTVPADLAGRRTPGDGQVARGPLRRRCGLRPGAARPGRGHGR